MPKAKGVLAQQSGAKLLADLADKGQIEIVIEGQAVALTRDEIEVRIQAKAGWTSANDRGVVVVLATEITEELLAEGWMRDLVRVIQDQRKEVGCDFTDRIELAVVSKSSEFQQAVETFRDYVMQETLASKLQMKPLGGSAVSSTKIGEADVEVYLQVAP
jgi:isoleucyl-tRNA synthetase